MASLEWSLCPCMDRTRSGTLLFFSAGRQKGQGRGKGKERGEGRPSSVASQCSTAGFSPLVTFCRIDRLPHGRIVDTRRRNKNERAPLRRAAPEQSEADFVPFEERDYPDMEATETEDEARRKNWVLRGWAPWEEILTPEAQFAIDSLADGEETPEVSLEAIENLIPKKRAEKQRILEEESERIAQQQKQEKPNTSIEGTFWNEPWVFSLIPPRDWPPPGWEVDPDELAFIREAHALSAVTVTPEDLDNVQPEGAEIATPRWEMFLKQYAHWFAANKDRLDAEALEVDPEYYPGRRRTGDKYLGDWMYELPFVYPGQHWWGEVTCVNLYEGAFVTIGCVHDAWVAIRDNDWFYIRNYVKVGMRVHVEILAKRDPYRYRFPIEARFVDPNVDHLIFKRFDYPPIMTRPGDASLDDLARETHRPFLPELRPEKDAEDGPNVIVHPHVPKLWQLHVSEQMILDDEEGKPTDDEFEDENWKVVDSGPVDLRGPNGESVWWDYGEDEDDLPTLKLKTDVSELDLVAARAERKRINKLRVKEGDNFKMPKLRLEKRMEELNNMHNLRFQEEEHALARDTACRLQVGLPLEEPGRYMAESELGKKRYDPRDKSWRNDYWGNPATLKDDTKRDRQPRAVRTGDTVVEEDEELETWASPTDKDVTVDADSDSDDEGMGGVKASGRSSGNASSGGVNGIATLRFDDLFNEGDWRIRGDEDPRNGDDVIDV